jgi:AcrR family transcriptional regulator
MSGEKRPYRMQRRAELEEQTRRRITESTVELHGTVGPANTSVTAVAERARVRRSTVYRHFPDEAALFAACSAHWRAANPPPDLQRWAAVVDPDDRLQAALAEQYRYYRSTEGMMANLLRDSATVPIVAELLGRYRRYLEAARTVLMEGRGVRGGARRRTRAAIGHALAFATWRSLAREQELDDAQAAQLMCRLVEAA